MSIPIVCPACKAKGTAPEEMVGKDTNCPKCGFAFLVRRAGSIAAPPPVRFASAQPAPEDALTELEPAVESYGDDDSFDDIFPPDAPVSPAAKSLRYVSPSLLVLALLLFPLPWSEFQCNGQTLISQSGVQSIYGGYSLGAFGERFQKSRGPLPPAQQEARRKQIEKFEEENAAPWMALFPMLLLGGVAVSFVTHKARPILRAMVAGVALLLLLIQAGVGFLPQKVAEKAEVEMQKRGHERPSYLTDEAQAGIEAAVHSLFKSTYTPWFWLAMSCVILAIGGSVAEWIVISRGSPAVPL